MSEAHLEQIQRDPAVVAAYLGTSEDEAQAMTEGLQVQAIEVNESSLPNGAQEALIRLLVVSGVPYGL